MSLTEKLSRVRALLLTPESDSGNSSSNGTIDEARMSLEEDQTPESRLPFSLTPVSVSVNGSSGNGTVDDDIRRRKSFPKTSPRHTENLRKSMQIDDLSLRQKFRLHLKLKRAEATASKQEEKAKDKAEEEPGHDNNKSRRYSQIVKVQSGLSALAKWKVKTKATGTSNKVPPIVKFRSYARLALLCARLCKYSHENIDTGKSDFLSIIQNIDEFVPILSRDGLFFDPKVYRANKEDRLPAEARKILKRPQHLRTKKDNKYLQIILRSIKAFAEYPNKMQSSLCQVGWYEAYEPKRVIVRQGQPPHTFYFILSGSVIVTTFDSTAGQTRYLVSLHRGMSFGELAVITRSKRQATVSTSTAAEFLCISANDFENIFMAGGIKSVTDPDHNSFIRSIPFLKHWPLEILPRFPQACVFHFFPRGQVLVRDSRYSDWLYIVKSGSISVLKKLKAVEPRSSQKESDSEYDDDEEDEESKAAIMLSAKRFGTWNYRVLGRKRKERKEPMAYKNNIEMEKRLEETLPGFRNTRERLGIIDYDEIIEEHKAKVVRRMSVDIQGLSRDTSKDTAKEAEESENSKDDKATKLPKIRRTSKGAYLASMPGKSKSKRKEDIHAELLKKQLEYDKKMRDDANVTVGRKTITNELDNKPIKDLLLTEADLKPMFVLVQVLERGQYFGVSNLVFPDQPSFSVVSNGSECIMISKKLFLEKANDAVMMNLREIESPYPGDDELQSSLQDYVEWQSVRSKIYQRLVQDKMRRNIKRTEFVPQYAGQYCFRAGPIWR